MNILAYCSTSKKVDIYVVADRLEEQGWVVDRQQFPPSVHTTVMSYNIPVIDQYVSDLNEAVEYARASPKAASEGQAAMYGLMARVPIRGMVDKNVRNIMMELYGASPEDDATTNSDKMEVSPARMGILNRVLKYFGR